MSSPAPIARAGPGAAGDAWAHAPFEPQLASELRAVVARLAPAQRLWLSGYLAALADPGVAEREAPAATPSGAVLILYGSQTGNAERLARDLRERLLQGGTQAELRDMADCNAACLQNARALLAIVSTHGDGDPPDRAVAFYEWIGSRKAPRLNHLAYSVLALGDSTYEHFCATGRKLDARLRELGAEPLHPRVDCDIDFDGPAGTWMAALTEKLARVVPAPVISAPSPQKPAVAVPQVYTRKNPFPAPVLVNQRLTMRGSGKDVRHIELSLEGSGIRYEPGDALGVVHENPPEAVAQLLASLPFAPDAPLQLDSTELTLREALTRHCEIGRLTRPVLERYAEQSGADDLRRIVSDAAALKRLLAGYDLIDLVCEHPPARLTAESFVRLLRPLAPRLYSIASSQRASPAEAHLTVALAKCELRGRRRRGSASAFLCDLSDESGVAPVYLHRNPNFRLPADPRAPLVMIGPGTGVAPFRAFLAEREALGAPGRNWLFFGDRTFRFDFLYQTEWLAWRKRGVLTRIDVAFSRDQEQKIYVQHRLREQGAEIWAWLEEGAHVCVCGDASRMAPDVHAALLEIIARHGGKSPEHAREYLLDMQRGGRYQRDVY